MQMMNNINIKIVKTGYLEENCYLIENDNECLIVDPGDDFEKIKENINKKVLGILITHRHFDHIGALADTIKEYNVPIYEKMNLEETHYKIGNFEFNVMFVPGHSKDSVVYYFYKDNIMFTGDFIFYHNIGRCDLEGGNFSEMKLSIEKIKKINKNVVLYPGHGESTTLEEEKENNIYFQWGVYVYRFNSSSSFTFNSNIIF